MQLIRFFSIWNKKILCYRNMFASNFRDTLRKNGVLQFWLQVIRPKNAKYNRMIQQ